MKTIVNLVSAQTLPNYLFVKEMFEQGDKIIWIVTEKMLKPMQCLENILPNIEHIKIELDKAKEENVEYIENEIKKEIHTDCTYLVNLTGSTKLISLSVYNFFKENCPQSVLYYMSIDKKNTIINIDTQEEILIKYRVSVDEYLSLYDLRRKEKVAEPYLSFEEAKKMYSKLAEGIYESSEISILREKKYKDKLKSTEIDKLEDETIKQFIKSNNFPTKIKNNINKYDVKYIIGGWLEDLIYYITEKNEHPDNILVGFHIYKGADENSDQELDVVFTKDNDLYIRECKTGFEKEKMFNEIVYKAAAIKTMFNSLGMKSSIYCCREKLDDNEKTVKKMNETLNKMGVTYFGKNEIDDELNKLN